MENVILEPWGNVWETVQKPQKYLVYSEFQETSR